ncbi:alpha/beta hydrolase [Streptomyces sp. PSAA01]|uniref:alpha/beta hydrolase n=1 Tax=Streptomyces sp. PSAA01 TaxID=2912762 RepID=UPI001F1F45F6|nr:alpha/beta hydrolase [Streptomyces sp. PSAA01]MCG0284580.1 alpha/beta hydrolase [Streptomyces sp. PSAA01]
MRNTIRLAAALLLVSALLSVGAQVPATAQDSGGSVALAEYDLGDTAFTDSESGTVSEVRARVHYPRHLTGRLPLIVMAHGSWWACDSKDAVDWPCTEGSRPFPSYRGYDYLGAALAARGFVVVSISVDAINQTSFDYGDRARLVNEHLGLWQQLAAGKGGPLAGHFVDPSGQPVAPDFTGHLDMTRVGTLGHSRGGKGVMWQASDKHRREWPAGVRVRAVLGLAPVKFDDPEGDHSDTLITKLPFAVVTGSCDGAVREGGQEYLDDVTGLNTATDYSISLKGANHNYYNTTWTPPYLFGEDDSTCPAQELAPSRQQDALTAYATAFFRYELQGDRDGLPVLSGERALPGVTATTRVVPARR